MAVASFQDLCAGYCEIINVAVPALTADAHGRLAFHVMLRGATVNLVYSPHESEEHLFAVFEFGPVGQESPASFEDLLALLEANFTLLKVHPPVFSRNPATGDVVLQYVYPLFDATPHGLSELIESGIGHVVAWNQRTAPQREYGTLPAAQNGPSSLVDFA